MVPYVKVVNDAPQYRFSTIGKGTIVKKIQYKQLYHN